jgi:hypothetical protein
MHKSIDLFVSQDCKLTSAYSNIYVPPTLADEYDKPDKNKAISDHQSRFKQYIDLTSE